MNRQERRRARKTLTVIAISSLLALPACAVGGALDPQSGQEAPSVAHLQLSVPVNLRVGEVAYEITGNQLPPIDGVMVPSATGNDLGAVVSLPSGRGYVLRVSTLVGDNFVLCQTSTMFDVAKGAISTISVLLKCDDTAALDGGKSSPTAVHTSDAAAKQATVDAGKLSADAASSAQQGAPVDAASTHGDASVAAPVGAVSALHDAGTHAGSSPADLADAGSPPSGTPGNDAGAPPQAPDETCDECRLRVCATAGNAERILSCFVAASGDNDWSRPGKPGVLCGSPAECVRFLCGDACTPRP